MSKYGEKDPFLIFFASSVRYFSYVWNLSLTYDFGFSILGQKLIYNLSWEMAASPPF